MISIIRQNPGISTGRLARKTNMSWGTLTYHVARLIEAGHIVAQRENKQTFLSLPGQTTRGPEWALRSKVARRIARLIVAGQPTSVIEIAAAVHRGERVTYYHIRRLIEAGLVRSDSRTRLSELEPSSLLSSMLNEFGPEE